MINNFKQIESLLVFQRPTDFYFIQIIKRRKDNPGLDRDAKMIDIFYVYSKDDFIKIENKIIDRCKINNARAYIHLNVRNSERVGFQTLRIITEYIIQGDFKSIKNAYNTACGRYSDEKENKKWIVDIDADLLSLKKQIMFDINEIQTTMGNNNYKIITEIPTNSGVHIITNPFNKNEFRKKYHTIDIHTDNPTLLFIP